MSSRAQIEANRENAKKSTGPKTPEGRAAVRLNGLKHGLSAQTIVVMGEDPAQFEALFDSLHQEHQPVTTTEVIMVRQLAMAAWRQLRLYRMEAGFFNNESESHAHENEYQDMGEDSRLAYILDCDGVNAKALVNFHRFEVRRERSIRQAIHELRRCRAERLAKNANQTQSEPKPAPIRVSEHIQTVETPSQPVTPAPELQHDDPLAA